MVLTWRQEKRETLWSDPSWKTSITYFFLPLRKKRLFFRNFSVQCAFQGKVGCGYPKKIDDSQIRDHLWMTSQPFYLSFNRLSQIFLESIKFWELLHSPTLELSASQPVCRNTQVYCGLYFLGVPPNLKIFYKVRNLFHLFGPFFKLGCTAKLYYQTSVPRTQKGWKPLH